METPDPFGESVYRFRASEIDRMWRCGCGTCMGKAVWEFKLTTDHVRSILRSDYPSAWRSLTRLEE